MSRTFRRLTGDQSIIGWGSGDNSIQSYAEHLSDVSGLPLDYEITKLVTRYHSDSWGFCFNISSANRNLYGTRTARMQVRALTQKVLRLQDLEDTPLFPGKRFYFDMSFF